MKNGTSGGKFESKAQIGNGAVKQKRSHQTPPFYGSVSHQTPTS